MFFDRMTEQSNHTKVKICGLMDAETARLSVEQGVDAVGLMFYPHSRRFISLRKAKEIAAAVDHQADVIGVFVNPSREEITRAIAEMPLTGLQFHGDELPEFCNQWSLPWLKAVRVGEQGDLQNDLLKWNQAFACLLDTARPGLYGGSGQTFNWSFIPKEYRSSIILAGGLNAGNVVQAIREIAPFALDISSGVENESGNKSGELIKKLMQEINSVRDKH